MKTDLVRKTWPKIRVVKIKGKKFFQVDARRQGTAGKRETFADKSEAETRAAEIAKDFAENGVAGLAMPLELRATAGQAAEILKPFGRSILEAAIFYRNHLAEIQEREASGFVSTLADEWKADKESGKNKTLRKSTLDDIRKTSELLKAAFNGARVREVTRETVQQYLDGLSVGLQRKFNIRSRFSQFFNWCVSNGHLAANPCDKIEIHVNNGDVDILTTDKAKELLNLCSKDFPAYTLYHAISLFAGLRPDECQALKWESIHIDERTITVLGETSKVKETRNVHIEDNLFEWLKAHRPKGAAGFVTPQENFKKRTLEIHVAAGYKGNGENEAAEVWPQDVMRHSYGSYWLAKYMNRAQLAENMGNSIQIIKKHYKKVVSKSATQAFWSILPGKLGQKVKKSGEKFEAANREIVQSLFGKGKPVY